MCLDYVPCLEPIQVMPECVEPEAFDCLRECRECAPCMEYDDCLEVTTVIDPICLEPRAGECLDTCKECIPCASGDSPFMDCSECGRCEDCLPYANCLEEVQRFPDELRKCVSSQAITCFNECNDCSSCADKFYCLEAFKDFQPPVVEPPMPPMLGEQFVEITNYPCDTHEEPAETINQVYGFRGQGANGRPIFQGNDYPQWWIYWDDNCGATSPRHEPAWFLTNAAPDFGAESNLSGRFNDCTNTLKVQEQFGWPYTAWVDSFMCDRGAWNNVHMRNGHKVEVKFLLHGTDGTPCCKAMNADCLACSAGMSVADYCNSYPETIGCDRTMCCMAMTADCLACSAGVSMDEYCNMFPQTDGCHMPCHRDDEAFKAIVNAIPPASPTWPEWVAFVNEWGCEALKIDGNAARDWCPMIEGVCDCICQEMPSPSIELEECREDRHCFYPGCEGHDLLAPRCENKGEYGICMVGDNVCPKRPEGSLQRGAPEICTQHSDCLYSSCDIDGYSLAAHCSGADDEWRDCEKGECVCVHGNSDIRCEGKPTEFDLLDGGWCYDGRRDAHCPLNPERSGCMEFADGNYQINDQDSGEVFVQMAIKQYGCQGEARTSDNSYIRLQFFQNQILAIDEEGNFFTGIPEATGIILWNGKFRMTPIPCLFVYNGMYNKVNIDGHVEGTHYLFQDGCHATLKDNDGHEFMIEMNDMNIFGTMADGFMAGSLDQESFVIQWDNGFQSHPVFENEHPQCNEDKDRFVDYVRTVVPNMENPRVVDFVNRVSWEGCNVLRHDHDAKYDWCTFHPEARDACSCVCNEVNHPKPVCSHDQINSWIHRDLSYECSELFVASLADEHRPACGCLKTIDEATAADLFGSECYFTEWSDRSFMQMWRDCQWQ